MNLATGPATVSQLLQKVAAGQSGGAGFPAGLFPAYRSHPLFVGYRREDHSVFFTASTVYILQEICPKLPEKEQLIVQDISRRAAAAYPAYQSPEGTYNFYPRNQHFFPGKWLHRFRHFKLPDDIDDTALILLTAPHPPEQARHVRERLPAHANGAGQWCSSTPPAYARLRAYSTWFGQKMPIELDACALANLLLWIGKAGFPRTEHDLHSLLFLKKTIETGDFLHQPYHVSHNYATAPLLIYHLGRLVAKGYFEELTPLQGPLVAAALQLLGEDRPLLEKIILSTTLRRFGVRHLPPALPESFQFDNETGFRFFIGPFLSSYPGLKGLAGHRLTHLHWHSEAHRLALFMEWMSAG